MSVERRWAGRFLVPVSNDDLDDVRVLLTHVCGQHRTAGLELAGRGVPIGELGARVHPIRSALNLNGFDITGGPHFDRDHVATIAGRVAPGWPKWCAEHIPGLRIRGQGWLRRPALYLEALPVEPDEHTVRLFASVLSDLPRGDDVDPTPGYDEPLVGRWAEWVSDARDTLEVLALGQSR